MLQLAGKLIIETKVASLQQPPENALERNTPTSHQFVFSNPNTEFLKNQKQPTQHGVKHGFPYAAKVAPEEWLNE